MACQCSVREHGVPASYHSFQLFTLTVINPQLDQLAFRGAKFPNAAAFGHTLFRPTFRTS